MAAIAHRNRPFAPVATITGTTSTTQTSSQAIATTPRPARPGPSFVIVLFRALSAFAA